MQFNRHMNRHMNRHHSELTSHELHQQMAMNPSSESTNERKHQKDLRMLSSSNDSGNTETRSMENYKLEQANEDEEVVPMIRDSKAKQDVKQNVMNFLSGQQSYDEQSTMNDDSKKYLTRTILEELPRHGIQSNYDNERGPRFMTFSSQQMEQLPKAVQPQRLPMEDNQFQDMNKSAVSINGASADTFAPLQRRDSNIAHSMKTKRNSQENRMDDMPMMMMSSSNTDQMHMSAMNMEEPTERNVNNRNSNEQSHRMMHENMMMKNEMRARNQKLTMTRNGHSNNDEMMNTIYRN